MSSGMNLEQAKEYAKTMTYSQAVSNIKHGKGIKYRKATMIKLRELAEIADKLERDNGMTREEAIAILKDISWLMGSVKRWENIEAIDIAIEALSAEPSGDLISRADAIEAMEDLPNAYNGWSDTYDKACIIRVIEELPSAEHKHCWDCKHYEPKYNVCHAPEVVKQVTSKLKKPCDSLLKDDSAECKEQKSKLESADRPTLPTEMNGVKISDAIKWADEWLNEYATGREWSCVRALRDFAETALMELPSADAVQGEWIKHKGGWKDFDFYPTKYECSQCHYYVDECYDSIFCPMCGARMKGGAE